MILQKRIQVKTKLLLSVFFLFLIGCASYKKEFILVIDDHNRITQETTTSMLNSVNAALSEKLPDVERQKLVYLKDRLEYMSASSTVIRNYVYTSQVNEELMQELLRSRWNNK